MQLLSDVAIAEIAREAEHTCAPTPLVSELIDLVIQFSLKKSMSVW